jgi:O-acetyl-ADP-ribose deacetylase (regulator of RNase III)
MKRPRDSVFLRTDDLLTCGADVIVHQCNCVTRRALGLAASVFAAYPAADTYGAPRVPGTMVVVGVTSDKPDCPRYVCNLYAQRMPGRAAFETRAMRLAWFRSALDALLAWTREHAVEVVAFPRGIGCGLAGGSWDAYEAEIACFARRFVGATWIVAKKADV